MKIICTFLLISLCFSLSAQPDFGAVIEGPVLIEDTPGHLIMKSGNGSYWTLIIDGSGQLQTKAASFTNLDVTIANTETYVLNVSVGDEEGVSVFLQADHFNQSTIVMDASTNWAHEYRYTPANNYTGSDKVTLLQVTGSNGASPNTDFEYLTINFTITN